jgi:hypothetical protein
MVSGAFAKAFRADVQPVEIASALQRELDGRAAIMGKGSTMVPNHFVVELSPHDYERLDMYAQTLGEELAEVVRDHANEQKYQLRGTVQVTFAEADDLDIGVHRIRSSVVAGVQSVVTPQGPPPAERIAAQARAETTVLSGRRAPAPYLEVNGDRHPLTRPVTVLGRGTQVDLRIDDAGVSRRHAEIRLGAPPMIVDLNSTNGTTVDGAPIGQYELADGALIGIGETKLVFRQPAE